MGNTETRERRRQYLSPTAMAPVLVGFDGAAGGHDALELGRVLSSVRRCPCVVAVPEATGLAAEARELRAGSRAP